MSSDRAWRGIWLIDPLDDPAARRSGLDVLGPIFVSYRTSDGQEIVRELAHVLRAFGLPIWHDERDLPPGDIERRIQEALEAGLSGAVLVVTPDVGKSRTIREVELPHILGLEALPDFAMAVADALPRLIPSGKLDYAAADHVLALEPGKLRGLRHYAIDSTQGLSSLAHDLALHRMELYRRTASQVLVVSLQTRAYPHAQGAQYGLAIRTQPPAVGKRAPALDSWRHLQPAFAALPELVAASGATSVSLTGPAHLSVAYAFGAALPVTAGHRLTILDAAGGEWTANSAAIGEPLDEVVEPLDGIGESLAVFLDLVHTLPPTPTFQAFLEARRLLHAGSLVLTLSPRRRFAASTGSGIVVAAADRIHAAAAEFQVNRIALFLRAPFPAAVLLGQMLNTLTVELYEWEDGVDPPVYVPMVTVACGRGGSPIIAIYDGTQEEI